MGNLSNLFISTSYQSLIHLGNDNTITPSLVELQDGLGNSIGLSVNSAGNLSMSGSLTASLQEGHALVGGVGNKTKSVPTSSFGGSTNLGPLNQFTASQEILNNTFATTGSNTFTGANYFQTQIVAEDGITMNGQNIFGDGQILNTISVENTNGSLVFNKIATATKVDLQNLSLLVSGTFTSSLEEGYVLVGNSNGKTIAIPTSSLANNTNLGPLNAFTSSQESKNITLASYTGSVDTKFATIGTQSGSWENVPLTSLNSFTASQETKNTTLGSVTASLQGQLTNIGSQSGSWDNTLLNQFTSSQEILNNKFATTGSNQFNGNQNIIGQLTASALRVENNTHLDGTLTVTNDTTMTGDLLIQSSSPKLKLRDTSGGGFSSGYDLTIDTGSFIINDETHNRPVLSDIYNPSTLKHTTELTSEIIVISGSDSVTIQGNLTASLQNGYAWVGNGSGLTSQVPTSSFAENTDLGPLNSFTSSQETKNSTLASYTGSVNTQLSTIGSVTSSLNSYTSSNDTKWSNLGSQSGSFVTESETGSFSRTNVNNTFVGTQNFTNIVVSGTGSFGQLNYVSGSATIIGDAFIVLNTDTPTLRYAGLQVIDSGSGGTSSLEWDGDKDIWIEVDEAGDSAAILTGQFGTLGVETLPTQNKLVKGGGGTQLTDSTIYDDGSVVSIGTNLNVTGSIKSNGTSVLLDGALSQLNSFTSSQETKNSTLASYTGSVNTQLTNLSTSQSIDNQKWTNIALQSGSWDETADISNLNAFTASQETKNSTLATYTGSVDTKFSTIGTQSGSWDNTSLNQFTSSQETKNTTLGSVTASLQSQLTNIGTQSGSWDNTSLNAFSASQETKDSTLATYTGSVDTKFDTIGSQSGSWENVPLTSLNAFTSSQQVLNAQFATTGSNSFNGNQQITGSFNQTGGNANFTGNITTDSNLNVGLDITADRLVLTGGTGVDLIVTGSGRISNTFNVGPVTGDQSYMSQYGFSAINGATTDETGLTNNSVDYGVSGWDGPSIYGNDPSDTFPAFIGFQNQATWTDGTISILKPLNVTGSVSISGNVTASLQQGYAWVGGSGNRTIAVSTSSFAPIGFATTGSNVFNGNQQITGSLSVSGSMNTSVIPLTITSNTASLNAGIGNTFQLNLVSGSATRLEITGTQSGQTINLLVSQSATGPGTLVLGGNIVEPSGSFYSASAVASAEDIVTFATFINPSKVYTAYIKNLI